MRLVTVEEMKDIERESDANGLSFVQMMENAGGGLADFINSKYSTFGERSILGLVGTGNNGGDTLIALEHLAKTGWQPKAYLIKKRAPQDELVNRLKVAGGEILLAEDDPEFKILTQQIEGCSILVDGVLGTGIRLPLKPEITQVLASTKLTMARMKTPPQVVAVDCPTGVDCDNGQAAEETLTANVTITMAAVKQGLLRFPAFSYLGQLIEVDIGMGAFSTKYQNIRREVANDEMIQKLLPKRPADAHKGTFGTALIVGGSLNYSGAVLMSGEAAYRIGTGLVTLAIPTPLHSALAGQLPEATWLLLPHEMGVISSMASRVVADHLDKIQAILMGPGWGLEETTQNFLAQLLGDSRPHSYKNLGFLHPVEEPGEPDSSKLPSLVMDADGLKLLARITDWPNSLPKLSVLTPHPGEMSVLTGIPVREIQQDRISIAEKYARQWGHVVVLKGAFTVISEPGGRTVIIPVATSALAKAGTGDVLAGIIVGLCAQGLDGFSAAVCGAWVHAQAGILAEEKAGNSASVLAGDVVSAIAEVLKHMDRG